MNVVISEFMEAAAVALLASRFDVRYDETLVDREVELRQALDHADALIVRNRTQVNAALLGKAPRLAVVGRLGVGLDTIDVRPCGRSRQQLRWRWTPFSPTPMSCPCTFR